MQKSNVRLMCLSAFYVFFLVVGAAIFSAIEGPIEMQRLRQLQAARDKFMQHRQDCLSGDDLDEFIDAVVEADRAGVSASHNVSNVPNWSFGQSLFFAASILTTVGYGHVSPLSDGGKIFCVIYAVIGIPLTLIFFTAVVERLMIITTLMYNALVSGLGQSVRVLYVKLTHVFIIFCFVLVVVFLVPSAVFTIIETDWNFLDAFYYCFISMTTIGLGDYIPGEQAQQLYRTLYKISASKDNHGLAEVLASCRWWLHTRINSSLGHFAQDRVLLQNPTLFFYLFFGLILMLLLVANVYDVPELNFGRYFYVSRDEGAEERQRLQSPSDVDSKLPRYTTSDTAVTSVTPDAAAAEQSYQQSGSGSGSGTRKSKKAEDKKRLTDDSL